MDIQAGDVLIMKKNHPCGDKRWIVMRSGEELRLRCVGCGHEIITPRYRIEKNIRSVQQTRNLSE